MKAIIITTSILALLLLGVYSSKAQSGIFIDTLQWNVLSIRQLDTNEPIDVKTIFITYGTSKIEWIQLDNIKKTFTVAESQVNWANSNEDGNAEFLVESATCKGKIIFTRQSGLTTIEFSFTKNDKPWLPYSFTISSINN